LGFEVAFTLGWGKAQEVQDELTQYGEIVSRMIRTSAHLVVAKDHVHTPAQTVLDPPMLADGVIHPQRVGRQAIDIEKTVESRCFPLDRPFADDHRERLDVWLAFGGVQAIEQSEDRAAPDFQPARLLLDHCMKLMRGLAWRRLEGADEIADRFGQRGLIVLDRQDRVGVLASRSRMVCAISGRVPMASRVTMQSSSARVTGNSGMAVFSFDSTAVARRPSTKPAWAAKALTRGKGVASAFPERRLVLPSMASTSSFARTGTT